MARYGRGTRHENYAMPVNANLLEVGMHWAPASGGVDRYFYGLTTAFLAAGVQFRAVAFDGEELEITKRENFESLGSRQLRWIERLRRLRDAARRFDRQAPADSLISTHFAFYALPMLRELRRYAHVVHFQGPWADETLAAGGRAHEVLAKRLIERIVYSTANRFITLSHAFKSLLIDRFAIQVDKIEVIPPGIDASAFNIEAGRREARIRLDWPRDRRIILCVRRLTPRMGLEQLIAAAAEVCRKFSDVLFLIAGAGALRDKLQSRIAAAGLTQHVKLLGFVSDADLPWAYRAADLSIVPTQSLEGFGLITLESMAAGTPVLVTPVGGLPEAVSGLNKELILSGISASHIAQGLIAALDGKIDLPTEEQCRNYVRANFDWSVIAPRVLNAYHHASHSAAPG